jgi:hypothetical protein
MDKCSKRGRNTLYISYIPCDWAEFYVWNTKTFDLEAIAWRSLLTFDIMTLRGSKKLFEPQFPCFYKPAVFCLVYVDHIKIGQPVHDCCKN